MNFWRQAVLDEESAGLASLFGERRIEQTALEFLGPGFDLLERKFEPERLRIELFLLVTAHREDVGCGSII